MSYASTFSGLRALCQVRPVLLAACLSALPTLGWAQAGHVHQHGAGQLDLVIDGTAVVLDITAPGADIVGFEHAPGTSVEHAAVQRARGYLTDDAALIQWPAAAQCTRQGMVLHHPGDAAADAAHHPGHEHGKTSHDAHAHGHASAPTAHAATEGHGEWHVQYQYRCEVPAALDQLHLAWFARFPESRELRVQALTPGGQIGGVVTAAQPVVRW